MVGARPLRAIFDDTAKLRSLVGMNAETCWRRVDARREGGSSLRSVQTRRSKNLFRAGASRLYWMEPDQPELSN